MKNFVVWSCRICLDSCEKKHLNGFSRVEKNTLCPIRLTWNVKF
ncbi:MAG: hypothetical protein NZT61_06135 [Deltaproteobacteria bacterium]|nr:hypothetical protein [Deltaproteobacteria bacterium]